MIPIIRYSAQELPVGDLLLKYDVHLSAVKRAKLRKLLERYLTDADMWDDLLLVDLEKFRLILHGPDEVGHLYPYCL